MKSSPYCTVKQLCERHPALAEGGVRHNLFYADQNGLSGSGAVIRNGRRIIIHDERYFQWLEERWS